MLRSRPLLYSHNNFNDNPLPPQVCRACSHVVPIPPERATVAPPTVAITQAAAAATTATPATGSTPLVTTQAPTEEPTLTRQEQEEQEQRHLAVVEETMQALRRVQDQWISHRIGVTEEA